MYKFSYSNNNKSRPHDCGREDFERLIDSPEVKKLCDKAAAEPDHKKQNVIKDELPCFMFHATFPTGRRLKKDGVPSGLCMLDFDKVDDPAGLWKRIEKQALSDGCLLAHLTPSTRGLRLVMPLIAGMDVAESQAVYARKYNISIDENDTSVKDLSRCSYVVPRSYIYFIDWEVLFEGEPIKIKNEELRIKNEKQKTTKTEKPKRNVAERSAGDTGQKKGGNEDNDNDNEKGEGTSSDVSASGDNHSRTHYLEFAFTDIVREWLKEYLSNKPGYHSFDAPCIGDRDNTLYDLCRDLRNITERNFEWLSSVVPRWGLGDAEANATIASAIKADRTAPFILTKVLRKLGGKGNNSAEVLKSEMSVFNELYLGRLPKLPPPLRACLEGVDKRYHMPIIVGALALLCNYADKVVYRYSDGKYRRPNLLAFVLGGFASGKSSVTTKLNILMEPIRATDKMARDKDDEAREQNNTKKDSERGKVSKDFIKKLNIDTTDAALLKMQKIAEKQGNSVEGRLLPLKNFMFTEEASCVKKAMKNGKIMEAFRVAFDNGEWGKDTASDGSQAGLVNMSLDVVAECTFEVFARLINNENIENGTASRLLLSFAPDQKYEYMPWFEEESEKVKERMLEGVRLCREERGVIDDKRFRKVFRDWCNDIADYSRELDDDARDAFRKRAAVIGATCAVICAILWNKHSKTGRLIFKKEALDFGVVMAEYCLEGQVAVFKDYHEKTSVKISFSGAYKMTKNKVLFDELPDVFTRDMVKEKKLGVAAASITKIIKRFKDDDLIERIDKNTYRKKTAKGGLC